jgi:rare lipoprotein A (peptidoglycan hydrolase)
MVRVRVNDRFPAGSGRVVLISFKSAEVLDMLEAGVADADGAAGNSARCR